MRKLIIAALLTCSSAAWATLPDLGDIFRLVSDEKYEEADDVLREKWNRWTIDNSLTTDDHISLHFFQAYIEEKMGRPGPASFQTSRACWLWICQDHARKRENPEYTSEAPQNLGIYSVPDPIKDYKKPR